MSNYNLFLVFVLLIGSVNNSVSQNYIDYNYSAEAVNEEVFIDWSEDRKLTTSDFKGVVGYFNTKEVASTASGFGFELSDDNGIVSGSIHVRYYPEKSWWNGDKIDSKSVMYVLKHEQVHFDICELFGRKLYQGILYLIETDRLDDHNLRKLYEKLEKEYSRYQKKYDKATKHSVNRVEQHYWNIRVAEELEKLAAFKDYSTF